MSAIEHHLISAEYLQQQVALHTAPRGYGQSGYKHAETVQQLAELVGAESILDYGCGQGTLKRRLREIGCRIKVREYDPAISEKSARPKRSDLVVCTDVLEHIEPELLINVLGDLRTLTGKAAFFLISTQPAHKTLPDGRNAHLIVKHPSWWFERVATWFRVKSMVPRYNDEGIADVTFTLEPQ